MWTTSFWKDTAERVVSAFVTSLLGVLGTAEAADLHAIQWKQALIAAAVIAGLTLLKCLGAGTGVVGQKGSPSLVAPAAPASRVCTLHATRAETLVNALHEINLCAVFRADVRFTATRAFVNQFGLEQLLRLRNIGPARATREQRSCLSRTRSRRACV